MQIDGDYLRFKYQHMVGIYKITNPIGKSYIGLSKQIEIRWKSYKNMSFKTNNLLKKSLEEHKFENHTFEILEEINISLLTENKSNSLLRRRERWWIKELDTFKNGLNENGGGSGCDKHTAKSKSKIGAANRGKPKPKGFGANRKKWQHTEEFRKKISKPKPPHFKSRKGCVGPNLGKVMSEEQKMKISASNKGKKRSKEVCDKLSIAKKGKPSPKKGKTYIKYLDI